MSTYNLLNGYVGNKAPYVSKIKALFDKGCTKYVEPYVGGGAVYFSNPNSKYLKEWINDANPNLYTLYEALANEETRQAVVEGILSLEKSDSKEIAKVQFKKAKSKMLKNNASYLDKNRRIEVAVNTFHAYSQSFNCTSKSYSSQKNNERYKNETKRNLRNAMERLQTLFKITNWDGKRVIKSVKKKPEVQLMVDWPYVGIYRNSSQLYMKEMSGLYEHIVGAMELSDANAAVVMCDYRSQYEGIPTVYDAIFTGDEWHCFKLADTYKKCEVVKLGEKKKHAVEYVWTNRVPENAGLYLSLVDYKERITMDEYWARIKQACENQEVPDKHVWEYESTYRQLYGKPLVEEKCLKGR